MKRLMILPLLLVLLVSFSANAAKDCKKDWSWWEVGKITQDLNLSEDQKTQITDIATKFDPILDEAGDNYISAKTAYKEAKSNKEASSGDVIKAFDTMWDSKYKMKRVKLDRYLEMRDVLTQEQVTKLAEIKQAHKEKMKKRAHKMKKKHEGQMKESSESEN